MSVNLTVTKISYNQISATWEQEFIPNFNYTSPTFSLLSDGDLITFCLKITQYNPLTVYVQKMSPNQGTAIVTLAMRAQSHPGSIKVMLLKDCENSAPLSHYNQSNQRIRIKMQCNIKWLGFSNPTTIPRTPFIVKELCFSNVSQFTELEPTLKLVMNDGELLAHKNVLTFYSPVFLGMFTTPMKEFEEDRVVIKDIDLNTMETVLAILNSGETEKLNDAEVALKVLAVAEKYQMLILKSACESKLQLSLKEENVLELLEEAMKYNLAELSDFCIAYIIAMKTIPMQEVKKICLKNPNLLVDALASQIENLSLVLAD